MPITRLANRKPDAYRIIPKIPRYYAFSITSTNLLATIYASDGTWLADRGSIPLPARTYPPTADNGTLIASREGAQASPSPGGRGGDGRGGQGVRSWVGAVGAGALAWRSGANELTVWDITNAAVYTYQGTIAAYCSPPACHEGRLFWVEFPAHEDEPDTSQATFTLRHAACDLSDPQTLGTAVFTNVLQSWDLGPRARIAASPGVLFFETEWRENINHEGSGFAGARFPFAATGAAEAGDVLLDLEQGFAAADGTAVGVLAVENSLRAHSLALGAPSVTRWPTTGPWAFALALNAAVTADGTTALLYGGVDDVFDPVVLEAPSTATAGEPTLRQTIAAHPIHGEWPHLLFFLESSPNGVGP